MKPLEPPDTHHLSSAEGWFELGDYVSANEELEKITPALRGHPDVLDARWRISARSHRWDVCLDIGQAILKINPECEIGWVRTAQAFHGLKDYRQAFDVLFPAVAKFPDSAVVKYDLACYHCLLGRLDEARGLLVEAFKTGGQKLKLYALSDPDLAPLRAMIGNL
jgi:tetratricopeptide (TPR) repeat protein